MTQNAGFGAYTPEFTFFMDGGTSSRAESKESVVRCIDGVAENALSFSPDFVLFQEIDFGSTRSYQVEERKQLVKAFAEGYKNVFAVNYHSAYLMYPITEPHGKSQSGILTFSKINITSALRRSLPISTGVSKLVDLDRCYSVSRIPVENGKELLLYNVHLSAYGNSDEIRAGQMSMLFDDMVAEYEKGNYCVCGGDFNHDFTGNSSDMFNGSGQGNFSWAQPFPEEMLPEEILRCVDYTAGADIPSCRNCDLPVSEGPGLFIVDGFLVTKNVSISRLENIDASFEYSDHNPVVMTFSLQ